MAVRKIGLFSRPVCLSVCEAIVVVQWYITTFSLVFIYIERERKKKFD